MKTIKQAAAEKVNAILWPRNFEELRVMIRQTFIAGAVFAERWIPIEEGYPVTEEQVLVRLECTDSQTGKIFTQFSVGKYYGIWNVQYQYFSPYSCKVTHWRHIESGK